VELTGTITMTKDQALEKVREYRGAIALEDRMLARGYRALARGRRLIDLQTVIAAGGQYENGLPRLAAIRADATRCWVELHRNGGVTFRDDSSSWVRNRTRHFLGLPLVFAPRTESLDSWGGFSGAGLAAMVPPIPPRHRPRRGALGDYTVLWEATWERQPRPPGDPALLRRLGGTMYVVLATWDLTELERTVLAALRRGS